MNVLVVFYSLSGATERLALAAAVGAVQGRAAIRLRRLAVQSGDSTIEERLDREYVAPKVVDARWADAIVLGAPARLNSSSPALNECFRLLRSAEVQGKVGAALVSNGAFETLQGAMSELGLKLVPREQAATDSVDSARQLGRRVAESAGKSASPVLS